MNLRPFQQYFQERTRELPAASNMTGDTVLTHLGTFIASTTKLPYRRIPHSDFTDAVLYTRVIKQAMDYHLGEPVVTPNLGIGAVQRRSNRQRDVQRVQVDGQWFNLEDIQPAVKFLHPGMCGGSEELREYSRGCLNIITDAQNPPQDQGILGWDTPVKGLLFGSDLEVFVQDTRTGKVVPAPLLVPGSKQNPVELTKGTVHPDGIAVEVGCPPADTYLGLKANLEAILDEVKEKFFPEEHYQYLKDTHEIHRRDVQDFNKHREENPDWFISGCAPEYLRGEYQGDAQIKEKQRCTDWFFTGLHIHYGFTSWEESPIVRLDGQAFQTKVWNDRSVYQETRARTGIGGSRRSRHYGGEGAFRIKPYGVEDRSLASDSFFKQEHQSLIKALIKRSSEVIQEVL